MRPQMTEEEIRRDCRLAKYPDYQVGVLADLNLVSPRVIARIVNGESWSEATSKPTTMTAEEFAHKAHRGKPWSYNELMLLAQRRREGRRYAEIASELGRSLYAVRNAIHSYKNIFSTNKLYREFSEEDERVCLVMYRNGASLKRIADTLGRSPGTIRTFLKRKGMIK